MRTANALVLGLAILAGAVQAAGRNVPKDLSNVRGFNYAPASALGYTGRQPHYRSMWLNYDPAETERDLDLAKRLNLNQVRVMMSYVAWAADKAAFAKNLLDFVRACNKRDIGVMIAVTYNEEPGWAKGSKAAAREYAADLVKIIGNEPGLLFWDVANEPDLKQRRGPAKEGVPTEAEAARYMASVFHELDSRTPVTIGTAYVPGMEELADSMDVLQFHDYSPTRAEIRANIARAKQFAAKVGKPLVNGEIGCIARANPYDVTLEEHMKAGVGWYIWELMIVREGWGGVHGVFYEDGTVRDPSIVAALLGFFRNRGPNILPAVVDREGRVTRVVEMGKAWLERADTSWDRGLDLAEMAANLLEAGELIAMRDPPTRQVDLMRKGKPDLPALRALLEKYIEILEPYKRKE
jgi:hypothetical protein